MPPAQKESTSLAVDHWQTEESMHAARAKEDFQLAVDQSQTERNVIDHQRMKMDNGSDRRGRRRFF